MPQPSKLQNLKLRYMQLLWTLPALSTAVRTAWWSDRIPSCDVCNYSVHYQLNKYHHKISLMKHEHIKVEHPNTGSKKLLLESLIIGVHVTLQHPIQKLRLTMMMHHHSTFYWNWNWWQFRWLIMFGTKCTKKSLCYLLLYINIMYYASGWLFWYAPTKTNKKHTKNSMRMFCVHSALPNLVKKYTAKLWQHVLSNTKLMGFTYRTHHIYPHVILGFLYIMSTVQGNLTMNMHTSTHIHAHT